MLGPSLYWTRRTATMSSAMIPSDISFYDMARRQGFKPRYTDPESDILRQGQFILGEPLNQVNRRSRRPLRRVSELCPESVDSSLDDDGLPSCSAVEAIEKQEPFVNQVLAQHALSLLARLFRYGRVSYHGGVVNLREGCSGRLPVDPDVWRRIRRRSAAAA